jgi:hypothetical protein
MTIVQNKPFPMLISAENYQKLIGRLPCDALSYTARKYVKISHGMATSRGRRSTTITTSSQPREYRPSVVIHQQVCFTQHDTV